MKEKSELKTFGSIRYGRDSAAALSSRSQFCTITFTKYYGVGDGVGVMIKTKAEDRYDSARHVRIVLRLEHTEALIEFLKES